LGRPRAKAAEEPAPAPAPVAAPVAPPPPAAAEPAPRTVILDKPLRSGQRFYARGSDLIVMAMVSAGAEVIADGNIHVYAPLRGRALAGASGDKAARIFTTSLEAELVSVAGLYRTFEAGVPAELARQPATVSLLEDGGQARLNIASLALR
ncbi:septum site-determining protein MinC, partial [Dechloromonas denitrificans]|uniref:septum site-determining protein MinC n=1 Tax=Dechloromonas denitrificans TaxID=281362 RepID=UPI0012FB9B38